MPPFIKNDGTGFEKPKKSQLLSMKFVFLPITKIEQIDVLQLI